MKTTLNISDALMRQLKAEAARRRQTMSQLVELALRALLRQKPSSPRPEPLPEFDSGDSTVDLSDRNALYEVMERG